ncbi:MAG: TIGR03067 domain-containing protein [Gemmataceae bacterium]
MGRSVLTAGVLLLAVAAGVAEDKKSPLDGKWAIESVSRDGKADPNYAGGSRTHENGKYVMTMAEGKGPAVSEGTFTVDADKKTIDMNATRGRYKDKTLLGIYKLDGDTLTIAFAEPGKDRPKEFTSKEGNGVVVAVMKKAK